MTSYSLNEAIRQVALSQTPAFDGRSLKSYIEGKRQRDIDVWKLIQIQMQKEHLSNDFREYLLEKYGVEIDEIQS